MIKKCIALLLIAGLAVSVLSCSGGDQLEKARHLAEAGEPDAARTILEESLAKKPDWHQARAFLVEVELRAGAPRAALDHIPILFDADYDISFLPDVLGKISVKDNITFVAALLEAEPIRGQSLAQVVLNNRSYHGKMIETVLPLLVSVAPENEWPLDIWRSFLAKNPVAAWQLSAHLPEEFRDIIIYHIIDMEPYKQVEIDRQLISMTTDYPGLAEASPPLLEKILDKEDAGFIPENPDQYSKIKLSLILIVNPKEIEPRHLHLLDPEQVVNIAIVYPFRDYGYTLLRLLIALENQGYEPANLDDYRRGKSSLVHNFSFDGPPTEDHFRHLSPHDLWFLAIYWHADYPEYDNRGDGSQVVKAIAKILKTMDPSLGKTLEQIFDLPPPPKAKFEIPKSVYSKWEDFPPFWGTDFSPDGNHMMYHEAWWMYEDDDDLVTRWVNLQTQKIVMVLDGAWNRHWTRDSSILALSSQDIITIYSASGTEKIRETNLPPGGEVLGWRNENILQILSPNNNKFTIINLDINTGNQTEATSFSHKPSLTTMGKAGAAWLESGKLMVNIDGEVREYETDLDGGSGRLHSWLPRDRGLIWSNYNGCHILEFSQGTWTSISLPLISLSGTWHGDREVYALVEIYEFPGLWDIVVLNIDTMEMTHTGIRTRYRISNSHIFGFPQDRLEIYELN